MLDLGTSVSEYLVTGVTTRILPARVVHISTSAAEWPPIPWPIQSCCLGNAMMVKTLFASPTTMHFMVLAGSSAGWSNWNLNKKKGHSVCLSLCQHSGRLPNILRSHTSCSISFWSLPRCRICRSCLSHQVQLLRGTWSGGSQNDPVEMGSI